MPNTETLKEYFIWEDIKLTEPKMKSENKIESEQNDSTTNTKIVNNQESWLRITKTKSGIYKIVNKIDGKYYVGSTNNFDKRWLSHRQHLRKNKHYNIKLQYAWNKYGEDSFQYIIEKEILDVSKILDIEQQYLDECRMNTDSNYNLSYDARAIWRNRKFSKEHCENISRSLKGKPKLKEHNRKVGDANRGKPNAKRIFDTLTFLNKNTGEKFVGTRSDFYKKYNLKPKRICELVNGTRRKSFHGWFLVKDHHKPFSTG